MTQGGAKDDDDEPFTVARPSPPAAVPVAGGPLFPPGWLAEGVPAPGDVVSDKYRIEECLGHGGMGVVFRATHILSGKRLALKWMLRSTSEEQVMRRFLREARAAARINHPNVVDVYDVCEHGNFGYLVMELLDGESLGERLESGRLSAAEAVNLLLPAMRGVAAAHAAGVVHRDIKPDNIFLCSDTDGLPGEVKVLDFGISSFTSSDTGDPAPTLDGAIVGTPAYMSPEQLKGDAKLDGRTDVYSMGVILYRALTGQAPYADTSLIGLVMSITNSDPLPPRSLQPDLPIELEKVVQRAIARDRNQRYQDMGSFIAALQPFATRALAEPASTERGARKRQRVKPTEVEREPGAISPSSHTLPATVPASAGKVRSMSLAIAVALSLLLVATLLALRDPSRLDVGANAPIPRPSSVQTAKAAAQPRLQLMSAALPASAGAPDEVQDLAANPVTPGLNSANKDSVQLGATATKDGRHEAKARASQLKGTATKRSPTTSQPLGRSGTISLDDL